MSTETKVPEPVKVFLPVDSQERLPEKDGWYMCKIVFGDEWPQWDMEQLHFENGVFDTYVDSKVSQWLEETTAILTK